MPDAHTVASDERKVFVHLNTTVICISHDVPHTCPFTYSSSVGMTNREWRAVLMNELAQETGVLEGGKR